MRTLLHIHILALLLLVTLVASASAVTPSSLSAGMRDDATGRPIECKGRFLPCVRTQMTNDSYEVDVEFPAETTTESAPLVIDRTYRAPGTRAFKPLKALTLFIEPAEVASVDLLALIDRRPGTTCIQTRSADASVRTTLRCVRYRPPVSIGWAGDITLGSSYGNAPGDGRSVFTDVRPLLRAPDLMIGNYEGTLSRGGSARCSGGPLCFIFQGPPRMARGLANAGFDVMNLANNHALDKGSDARRQSIRAFERQGMVAVGLPYRVDVVQVADTRVAMVGFGFTLGTALIRDLPRVRATVAAAAKQADVVVVLHHGGEEGAAHQHVPNADEGGRGNMRAFMRTAIDAGADVVFGSGPHVIRGIEQRDGRLAFHSTGNFAGWNNFARGGASSQSAVVDVELEYTGEFASGNWHGVRLTGPGVPMRDRSGSVLAKVKRLSREDFGNRAPRISRSGRITLR